MTAKANNGIAASQNSGQVGQAQNYGRVAQHYTTIYGNKSELNITINNPDFNLDSLVSLDLKKNLIDSISEIGHKRQVPEEKIEIEQQIISESTGSFGDLSAALLTVSGSIARDSNSSQKEILFDILRLTDLENYINYEVRPTWKCQYCGHINSLDQATCAKCEAPKK
jgi:hypothetical protein